MRLFSADWGGLVAVVAQPVLPLIPTEATPIGPIAALVEKPGEGGVVYVNGLATFCFDADVAMST